MIVHLVPLFNGVSDRTLALVREIAIGDSVTRDTHSYWFETDLTQDELDEFCIENNLVQVP